jgi:hypothetical protein
MTPGQHFMVSWVVANAKPLDRRSRMVITATGLLPDIDGFGYPIDRLGPHLGYSTFFGFGMALYFASQGADNACASDS